MIQLLITTRTSDGLTSLITKFDTIEQADEAARRINERLNQYHFTQVALVLN